MAVLCLMDYSTALLLRLNAEIVRYRIIVQANPDTLYDTINRIAPSIMKYLLIFSVKERFLNFRENIRMWHIIKNENKTIRAIVAGLPI